MKKSLIFGVLALTIVGLLSFAGGRASNSVASKSSNNKTESSYNSNKNTNNGVDKVVNSNKYNNSYNNSSSSSYSNEGSDEDICFELSEEDMQTIASLNKDTSSFFSHYDPATVEMICGLKR